MTGEAARHVLALHYDIQAILCLNVSLSSS